MLGVLSTFVCLAVFSLLILIHEWGHFVAARRCGVRVERFSLGFGPKVWSWRAGETEYCLSVIPLGGYVKMAGEHVEETRTGAAWEYLSQPIRSRAAIVAAGPILNYLLAWLAFVIVFLLGFPALAPRIGAIQPDKPAAQVDLRVDDQIRQINGIAITTWDDVINQIHARPEQPLQLVVDRDGVLLERTLIPQRQEMKDLVGRMRVVGLIGIVPKGEMIYLRYGFFGSLLHGTQQLWKVTHLTWEALWGVVSGRLPIKESLAGPIGVFMMTGEAARLGLVYVVHITAVLSLSLAIFNVLPIPILDGGHLLFLALERLRGRPVSLRVQTAATQAGLALLILLMVVVLYSDVQKFGLADKIRSLWRSDAVTQPAPEDGR